MREHSMECHVQDRLVLESSPGQRLLRLEGGLDLPRWSRGIVATPLSWDMTPLDR
jgi:hypothetical protein